MKIGSIVYHCSRSSNRDAEVETFSKPVAYPLRPNFLTIQPNNGGIYDETFGEFKNYSQKVCAIPYEFWDGRIKEGDRFYLEIVPENYCSGTQPDEGWGYDANYKVVAVSKQNRAIYYALTSIIEND